jgi:hypothetical protein
VTPTPRRVPAAALPLALALLGPLAPAPSRAQVLDDSRQVTVFGILATPDGSEIDPKLKKIAPQLRRIFPEHGFRLLGVETRRVEPDESVTVALGEAVDAGARLVTPLDPDGKAELRVQIREPGRFDFETTVNTPLNQLFFLDKRYPDGSRLIVGIGVRE